MERSGFLRWALIGGAIFLMFLFGQKLFNKDETARQPLKSESTRLGPGTPERFCDLWTDTFRAQLTTKGASLKHFYLLGAKYKKNGHAQDLSTTPDLPFQRLLRFHFRNEGAAIKPEDSQVDYDQFDWNLERSDGKVCVFSYRDQKAELTQVVSATSRPYELMVRATVKNLDRRSLRHALSIQTATWRPDSQIGGHMFRVSPFLTHVECVSDTGKTVRLRDDSFEPKDFSEDASFSPNQLNPGDWYQAPGKPSIAAVSNAYFSNALIALDGVAGSACQLQIEDRWRTSYGSRKDDPDRGRMYRARIAYEPVDLAPNQTKEYQVLAYVGPKEREVMEHAGGGGHHVSELIDLGFFSAIAKVLVAFLLGVHRVIPNWGIAIVVLTLTARVLLFPLTVPSIRSMIKMRELKPELDAIGQKYKDDQQARGLAQMELWRKHKVNPLKGCLPQLASMPVWFALYTTLQTAVELYNIPFLWFPDLSEPDPYFILPFIIGSTSFLQQKLMPIQAGDPSQQKMLLYFMPAMFTVFMLFLPAGLGVYMFTNGVLGIIQQQSVEWHARRATPRGGPGQGKVSKLQEPKGQTSTSGRRQGSSNPSESKVSESRPLLGKGKA